MEDHSGHGNHGGTSHESVQGYAPEGCALPGGLAVAANGLRFEPSETRFESGTATDWSFQIVDEAGQIVTDFDDAHGQQSHLIVVRRDLTRFQHLHPELEPDGTWHVENLLLPEPGVYRAFVDIVVAGKPTTLGFDLFTTGTGQMEPRPTTSRHASANGYEVELLTDEVSANESIRLQFEVRRDGDRIPELGPYLGALGHLVALREGDLAYLHVHPEETDPDSGQVEFAALFPTPGRYRLFLQTKPEENLITTQFDIRIS